MSCSWVSFVQRTWQNCDQEQHSFFRICKRLTSYSYCQFHLDKTQYFTDRKSKQIENSVHEDFLGSFLRGFRFFGGAAFMTQNDPFFRLQTKICLDNEQHFTDKKSTKIEMAFNSDVILSIKSFIPNFILQYPQNQSKLPSRYYPLPCELYQHTSLFFHSTL